MKTALRIILRLINPFKEIKTVEEIVLAAGMAFTIMGLIVYAGIKGLPVQVNFDVPWFTKGAIIFGDFLIFQLAISCFYTAFKRRGRSVAVIRK